MYTRGDNQTISAPTEVLPAIVDERARSPQKAACAFIYTAENRCQRVCTISAVRFFFSFFFLGHAHTQYQCELYYKLIINMEVRLLLINSAASVRQLILNGDV